MSALKVLVVEDEGLVAIMLEDLLEDIGCQVVGSAASVREALRWVEDGGAADAALLDVSLGGEYVFPVARLLTDRGVPFAFTTGYGELPGTDFTDAPLLRKPIRREHLEQVLRRFGHEV